MNFQFGKRFQPTDEELISHYLKRWILGPPLSKSELELVVPVEMYGDNKKNPWELFSHPKFRWHIPVDPLGRFNANVGLIYVFTKLGNIGQPEISDNKTKNRVAGCGTWLDNNTTTPEAIYASDDVSTLIGYKRSFTFETTSLSTQENVGQWSMIEYSLDPQGHGSNTVDFNYDFHDFVLCKIKRDRRKSTKTKDTTSELLSIQLP